jgi:hypothetical protein
VAGNFGTLPQSARATRLEQLLQPPWNRTFPRDGEAAVRTEGAMSCTRSFLGFKWEHHHWQPRVTAWETVTGEETNMWARTMYRDYVRCDKEQVCTECGKVRHEVSCLCDTYKAEKCPLLLEQKARVQQTR